MSSYRRRKSTNSTLNSPYYIVPDGEVGQQAFAVIREAIRKEGMVGIAKVIFTSREHIIALEARGKGLIGVTLRYPYEVRKQDEYFDEIPDEKIPKDMLELASHIVGTKAGHFDPDKFDDRYEDALKELIRKKQSGKPIERPERHEPAKVINLMDALRRSVQAEKRAPAQLKKGPQAGRRADRNAVADRGQAARAGKRPKGQGYPFQRRGISRGRWTQVGAINNRGAARPGWEGCAQPRSPAPPGGGARAAQVGFP